MFKKLKAFTLAEALIVVAIIGVISVTVLLPILNKSYNRKSMHSALKKNYYVVQSALDRYEANHFTKLTSIDGNKIRAGIKPYLNIAQDCEATDAGTDYCAKAEDYKVHTGTDSYTEDFYFYTYGQLVLDDGSLLMFGKGKTNPNGDLLVYVDVNGKKGEPNQFGFDTFILKLDRNGILRPMGDANSDFPAKKYCTEGASGWYSAFGCAYNILVKEK